MLIVVSQIIMVRMVYAHQIDGKAAYWVAKIYNLKAGSIVNADQTLRLPLSEYFSNASFVRDFLVNQVDANISEADVDSVVWNKLLKNVWLKDLAQKNDIKVTNGDIEEHINSIGDPAKLEQARAELGMTQAEYETLVIRPFILESKVYEFLIDNYNDIDGVTRAQMAFDALESGQSFDEVAREYSDDPLSYEQSVFLSDSQLIDFYEPIRDLQPGQHSKIVKVQGAYLIWHVVSIIDDEEKVYEVKGIFMIAKTVDEFFQDFIDASQVNREF